MKQASAFRRMIDPLERRVRLMAGRAIVRLVDDAAQAQALQLDLLADEAQDNVERLQNYGFTSHPHPGAEAVMIAVGGLRSHGIVVAVEDRRYRLTGLDAGEVAIYDDRGQVVKLARDGITIDSPDEVRITAPIVTVEAAQECRITADSAIVISDDVQLGGEGGEKVARVGDSVDLATGLILTGSDKVRSA